MLGRRLSRTGISAITVLSGKNDASVGCKSATRGHGLLGQGEALPMSSFTCLMASHLQNVLSSGIGVDDTLP